MFMLLRRAAASVLAAKPGKMRFFARETDGRLTAINEAGEVRALAFLDEIGGGGPGSGYDPSDVAITGGSINGTAIGGTTPASGKFTSLESTSDALIHGVTVGQGSGSVDSNLVFGRDAFLSNTTGSANIAIGSVALLSNTTGSNNTALGGQALVSNTTGQSNTALGGQALLSNTVGNGNLAVGNSALEGNTSGSANVAYGGQALKNNTTGNGNLALGDAALKNNTTGSNNTAIGPDAGADALIDITTQNNQLVLGNFNVTDAYIKVALTVVSDARDKTDIAPLNVGLDFVNALIPSSFKLADRETQAAVSGVRYGFLAQDVLELEGGDPVIVNKRDPSRLKMNEAMLIPVLVRAVQELSSEIQKLKAQKA